VKRRTFIAGLGSAAAWPLAAWAQQDGRVRRIGVLRPNDENDPLAKAQISAFTQALAGLGWTDGRNVRLDLRWAGADINRIRALAQSPMEFFALSNEYAKRQFEILTRQAQELGAIVQQMTMAKDR
jgi:putative ABC transport system substrate-binding protein